MGCKCKYIVQMFITLVSSSLHVDFATRLCGPRGWHPAAVQECASFDFMNGREEVKKVSLL